MMAEGAGQSIPKQAGSIADAIAAYRLLSNSAVDPGQIQAPHRAVTRQACVGMGVVLVVSDISELDYTSRPKIRGLGKLGAGTGRGLQQFSTLGLSTRGQVLGVLYQQWYQRPDPPDDETRRQQQARWCEADTWLDAVREVGAPPQGCRFIHVCDRGADSFRMIEACQAARVGFLIRAVHDRRVEEDQQRRLWDHVASGPVLGERTVEVSAHRRGPRRTRRIQRRAKVRLRAASVTIPPPVSDPRCADSRPCRINVVMVREDDPPAGEGIEPVEWMLLTSEPVETLEEALRVTGWYAQRWKIEEFHRAEKEGCRLEASQLDDAQDIRRLAAILGVVAVRLLQLRDLAEEAAGAPRPPEEPVSPADDPRVLRSLVPPIWIQVVALLAKAGAEALTPRQFWRTIAQRGGWLGRSPDGRPGWKTVWRGWYEINLLVQGAQLQLVRGDAPPRCV